MDEFEDLLNKYVERFNENFPIFLVMGMGEEEVKIQIEESLETGKPFNPDMDQDKDYQHVRVIQEDRYVALLDNDYFSLTLCGFERRRQTLIMKSLCKVRYKPA